MGDETAPRQAYVYVIACGRQCKIGYAVNVEQRLKSLQAGNHRKLVIVSSVVVPLDHAPKIESVAHYHLANSRSRGEWFMVDRLTATRTIVAAAHEVLNIPLSERIPFGHFKRVA